MKRRKPSYTMHDGFRMPRGFPVEGFASALQYQAQPGDVFIATYPKCGTTWAQHIVYMILNGGEALPPERSVSEVFPHLEEVGKETVAALAEPRLIKTHLPFAMTPYHREAKYIYVARNPFDCAVSFYHHTRGFVKHYDFAEGTFDDFFECFLTGEVDFGDYFDNLMSWYEHKDDDNALFLTYEQMKANPAKAVAAIGLFLGPGAARVVQDSNTLERILHHSSFESMRKDQQRWSSERPHGMPEFVRKGTVGDWVSHFSGDQARRLVEKFSQRTRGTGADELWPDIVEAARHWA